MVIPVSAVVATRNRAAVFARMLRSLADQAVVPTELIVVDASDDPRPDRIDDGLGRLRRRGCAVSVKPARTRGAATQRNEAFPGVSQPVVAFFDDDIVLEADCLSELWGGLQSNVTLGGVNALISNQHYREPGHFARLMLTTIADKTHRRGSLAGKLIGPGINLLPADSPDLPSIVPVEWLNTTCTLYRREALPTVPFSTFFTGYSMMEDVTLSVNVGRTWKLANVRTARVYHDSQSGDHKSDSVALALMELVNRHYVMTQVLDRRRASDYAKLAIWEAFQLAVSARTHRLGPGFWRMARGKALAVAAICSPSGKS